MQKPKILVPTDFSDCANNALDYALGLATDMNAEIILIHSIIYNNSSFIDDESKEEENTMRFNKAKENLTRTLDHLNVKNPSIPIKTLLDGGTPELSVSSVIDSEKIDYIVMGTEGASGIKAVIFGSFASNILLIAPCPVFTIPIKAQYKGFKDIVCATEMDESETPAIKHLVEMAKKFKAGVTFYNVNPNKKEQDLQFENFEKQISQLTNYPTIDYMLIESHDIVEAIDAYVCNVNPDLLVTLGKERDFFDKLFGKHVTKKLCLHATVPLLSYPAPHFKKKNKDTSDLMKKNLRK